MIISVVNRSDLISDADLQAVIRAINRQIGDDFEPYWSFGAVLRLEGKVGELPDKNSLPELRGDAVIYLWDEVDMEGALGYHDINARGIPYGFVFTELSRKLGENWTVTFSHEALELVGDAQGNLLVQGPHPQNPAAQVFHWFEMCDAVQAQTYKIDGVEVSNFLLPLYFTSDEQEGGRNDFLGHKDKSGLALQSFGVSPGGYIGYYDPLTRSQETYAVSDDKKALKRIKIKATNAYGRGYFRRRSEAPANNEDAHMQVVQTGEMVKASATSADDPIKHVVVLMLENRSFDHMLGGMTRFNPAAEGVKQAGPPFSNVTSDGRKVNQAAGAVAAFVNKRDPNHEHEAVMPQLGTRAKPMSGVAES